MKWRDVVHDYQQRQWDLMNVPSMYALEVFVAGIELTTDILQWLPDPEKKMKMRVKFHTLPCIELKGTYEENPKSVHKESMANIKMAKIPTQAKRSEGEFRYEGKGFNPLLCLVKEKQEPPVPKVHKLPGEDESDPNLKKGEIDQNETSENHDESITSQNSGRTSKIRKSDTIDTRATNKNVAEETHIKSVAFNDGRSVIFTSTPSELIHTLMTIPLAINIFINGPMIIGHTLLALHQFAEVISISIDSNKNIPCSAVLDGKFDIYNRGKYVGSIDLDLRLICLGPKMAHTVTLPDNPNEEDDVSNEATSTPSMRVLKINVREKPFTPRIEKLLESEGVSEYFYPPAFKEATIAPPMLLSDDFLTWIDNMNALEKTNVKRKKEWLRYKCTDMDTIIQRKVLEELIATQKPPFQKGSPFRNFVCPVYLKNKNLDWSEKRDQIYCQCDTPKNYNYIQCPAYQQQNSKTCPGFKTNKLDLNKDKTEEDPNMFYDPYLQCEPIDYRNTDYCRAKGSKIRANEEIDPEEALKTIANINKKVEHYKKVLNDLVLDSDVNIYHLDPLERSYKSTGKDEETQMKTPFDQATEQIIPQIIQKLPELIASQQNQQIPKTEKHDGIFQNGQWRCMKQFCKCAVQK